jgi:ABC-type amino acid transport substrate-binding protein
MTEGADLSRERGRRPPASRYGLAVGLALAAVLLFGGVVRAGDLAAVKARGKLVLLCHPVQDSPFVAVNLDVMRERGLKLDALRKPEEFTGAEVELAKGFARRLGVQLEIHAIVEGYDALLPALVGRAGDLAASELTITPKRLLSVDFSTPYVSDWLAVVARRDSKIASLADLSGSKGAVIGGSSHLEFLRAAAPEAKVTLTSFDLESLEAVEHGEADYTLIDTSVPVGESLDAMHPGVKVAFRLREFGDAIAVRKGSDLLKPLDDYLAGLKKSGELKRILGRNGVQAEKKSAPPRKL